MEWKDCYISDFDKEKQLYSVQWQEQNKLIKKQVTRVNIMYDNEHEEECSKRFVLACQRRNLFITQEQQEEFLKKTSENY